MSESENLALSASGLTASSVIKNLKRYVKFIAIDLKISVFGITLLEYRYPPKVKTS